MYGYNKGQYIPRSSWVGTANDTNNVPPIPIRHPLTKRAGFAFNIGSRQFCGCLNKTQGAETTAATNVYPANRDTLPSSMLVGEAETGTLYGIAEVEWNRNSAYGD